MSKYLVECSCGNKLPVEVGQAGGRITCTCGGLVDVPPLRKLRHLEADTTIAQRPVATWSARKGLMTACLIVASALLAVNAWSWLTQPKVPEFDRGRYRQIVETHLKKMTPAEAWNDWIFRYRPLAEHGFAYLEMAERPRIESIIAERRSLRRTFWAVIAIAAVIAAAAAIWPKPQPVTSRRSD